MIEALSLWTVGDWIALGSVWLVTGLFMIVVVWEGRGFPDPVTCVLGAPIFLFCAIIFCIGYVIFEVPRWLFRNGFSFKDPRKDK